MIRRRILFAREIVRVGFLGGKWSCFSWLWNDCFV